MVLATVVGLFGFVVLAFLLVALFCLPSGPSENDKPILHIKLEGIVDERSSESTLAFLGQDGYSLGLDDILFAIKSAETDDCIKGIFLEPGAVSCGSASLNEIRQALEHFKKSGKFIYAYSGAYTQGSYALATVADSVFLNPSGSIDWTGAAYRAVFYKRLLENVGIDMQVVKVGTYKSFTEQYSNEKMSDANREQASVLIGDLWGNLLNTVSNARGIGVDFLQSAADSLITFQSAEAFLSAKMVDKLAYKDQVVSAIRKRIGIDDAKPLPAVSVHSYVAQFEPCQSDNQIAVVYANGEIDNGNTDGINSASLSNLLVKLSKDADVKAVVLRVNSPGGSAYGSEQIWYAVQVLKNKKPVVVSMGDYAASGGYYMSCGADAIFASPSTMTGSIGIFGVIPNIAPLADKIGIDYDVVKTSDGADFPRIFGPMTPAQERGLQRYINSGYNLFVRRCSEGRAMKTDSLEKIAQGRVWSGVRAKQLGLVDELGTLKDAVDKAAELAKLDNDYQIEAYPKKEGLFDALTRIPALGVRMLFTTPQPFERERKALEQAVKLDMLQAAMPEFIVVE